MIGRDASRDPSSTTTTSTPGWVWPRALSMASPRKRSSSWLVITIVAVAVGERTGRRSGAAISVAAGARPFISTRQSRPGRLPASTSPTASRRRDPGRRTRSVPSRDRPRTTVECGVRASVPLVRGAARSRARGAHGRRAGVRPLGALLTALALVTAPAAARADCAADCAAAYRSCRGNPDTCLGQQGVCLSRCGPGAERHGAIAYSAAKRVYGYSYDRASPRAAADVAVGHCRKEDAGAADCKVLVTFHNACGALALGDQGAYGSAWALSQGEAAAKALAECRPHGGASCAIARQV